MFFRDSSKEQFIRQHMRNKIIFFYRKLLSIVRLDTHLAKTWLYTHLPEARNNTQTHNNFSLCYLRNRRYSLCFFQVVEVKRTIFFEFSLSFTSVYNLEYTDRSFFFFLLFLLENTAQKTGKLSFWEHFTNSLC